MAECSNKQPCPCTYPGCKRHGRCCECIAHHKNGATGCMFSAQGEKLWDRSLEALLRDRGIAPKK